MAYVGRVQRFVPWPIELRLTAVAVDTLCVVSAVLTDTAAFIIAVNIQRQVLFVNLWIVDTFIRVSKAVAGYKIFPRLSLMLESIDNWFQNMCKE